LVYETVYNKFETNEQKVTKLDNTLYQWPIEGNYTRQNVANGTFYISKDLPPHPDDRYKAIWLFKDLMRTYWAVPGDPGTARVRWQEGTDCAYVDNLGVFILFLARLASRWGFCF